MKTLVRALAVACLVGGAVLIVLGLRASDSFPSSIARLVAGTPTKESVMLLSGGGASAGFGLTLLLMGPRGKKRRRARR